MTHEQYLEEPAEAIDWLLAVERMRAEREADAIRRQAKRARSQQKR